MEVNLTVSDPRRSAAWYAELLGMEKRYEFDAADTELRYVCLVEPVSKLVLCLVGHASNSGEPFSEMRTGLDHLEFWSLGSKISRSGRVGSTKSGSLTPG